MKRKDFIKKAALTSAAAASIPSIIKAKNVKLKQSSYDKMMEQVGFNHLPNKEIKTMNKVIHKASTRGHANHGWLDAHHSFSFANYHNPERMHFGVLRVLNDDHIAAGKGFGTHPHDNMEIITIPLEGDLEHQDSMGNTEIIKEGDVQVMSAGTGIFHSEYNPNADKHVKLLQIWLFPNQRNVEPRYDQISLKDIEKKNEFYQILSPNETDEGVWIHQDAWFNLANFDTGTRKEYQVKSKDNGVYIFVIEGEISIDGESLNKRDGMGIWDVESFNLQANSNTKVLLMDVPMSIQ